MAQSILHTIRQIDDPELHPVEVRILYILIGRFVSEDPDDISRIIASENPDCAICAALAQHIQNN